MNRFYIYIFIVFYAIPLFSQYNVYENDGNLFEQVAVETQDRGFLVLSTESCYSPHTTYHHGCNYALFLVKTDARGDTLWSNQIESYNFVNIRMFENTDNSFTLIGRYYQTFGCSGIIRIMNISSTGILINTFDYTENCELDLGDVFQTEDGNYLIAVNYGPELISVNPTVRRGEGQLLRMDKNGNLLGKTIFTNIVPTGGVGVSKSTDGEIAVCFIDDQGDFNLSYYTEQFNFIRGYTDTTFINDCFQRDFPRAYFNFFSNGNIAASCYNKRLEDRNTAIALFDNELNLLNDSAYTLINPTNIVEMEDNRLLVASTSKESEENIRLTYLDLLGNEISSSYINHPENQQPKRLLRTSTGKTVVIGSVNCCDLDTIYGPSKAFLQFVNDTEKVGVSGTVFWDENGNGQLDENEVGLNNVFTKIEPEALAYYTKFDGKFNYSLSNGRYTLTPSTLRYWELSTAPATYEINFDGTTSVENHNFGYSPSIDTTIIEPKVSSAPTRCGNRVVFWIENINTGTQRVSGEIHIQLDSITVLNAKPLPRDIREQKGIWEFVNLNPTSSNTIKLEAIVPDVSVLGDSVRIIVNTFVEDDSGNLQTSNSYQYASEIRCAYDPNDKLVRPNRSNQYDKNYTLFEETLEYTIRFQNTGNDTAFTVVIQDQLDEDLDWTTFKPLTASHDFETLLNKDGLVEFSFKNILLPDSIINEPLSHGFVSYQIKPKADLAENTFIENTASIYFDANPPIITNTTESILVSELPKTTSTQNLKIASDISFYPNPTNSLLYVKTEKNINELEIHLYSSVGKLVRIYKAETILDVSNISTGIYFAEVRQNGTIISREKIIINN